MSATKSRKVSVRVLATIAIAMAVAYSVTPVRLHAHGDVTPQAVDTSGLPELGEDWLEENPWRDPEGEHWARALEVGSSAYNQNCARCHGLGAVSGGLAPDLRILEADSSGDEWYLERYRNGYTQNGITKMPAFGDLLGQEAAWAIRTYVETRPDEDTIEEHLGVLQEYRDALNSHVESGKPAAENEAELVSIKEKLVEISGKLKTSSGAPQSDSVASRAAAALDGSDGGVAAAAEILTVGLSAAQ